jgi:hypothetical protein
VRTVSGIVLRPGTFRARDQSVVETEIEREKRGKGRRESRDAERRKSDRE